MDSKGYQLVDVIKIDYIFLKKKEKWIMNKWDLSKIAETKDEFMSSSLQAFTKKQFSNYKQHLANTGGPPLVRYVLVWIFH